MGVNVAPRSAVAEVTRRGTYIARDSKSDLSNACAHCHRVGHTKATCFQLHPELKNASRRGKAGSDNRRRGPRGTVSPPEPARHLLTEMIAIDGEMVAGQGRQLIGYLAIVNYDGEVVWAPHIYEKGAVLRGTNYLWSGIRWADIRPENGAIEFDDFMVIFKELVRGRELVAHDGNCDYRALKSTSPITDFGLKATHDTQHLYGRRKLSSLAYTYLGESIQRGAHCPIEDARTTMKLFRHHKEGGGKRHVPDYNPYDEDY